MSAKQSKMHLRLFLCFYFFLLILTNFYAYHQIALKYSVLIELNQIWYAAKLVHIKKTKFL